MAGGKPPVDPTIRRAIQAAEEMAEEAIHGRRTILATSGRRSAGSLRRLLLFQAASRPQRFLSQVSAVRVRPSRRAFRGLKVSRLQPRSRHS